MDRTASASTAIVEGPQWTATVDFLRSRGADTHTHPGGTLLPHLERTARRLVSWDARPALVLGSLCHAVYGTDGFPPSLAGLDERPAIRALVGEEAEAIVYHYAAADRAVAWEGVLLGDPAPYRDRFTGATGVLGGRTARDFWELSVANEYDLRDLVPNGWEVMRRLRASERFLGPDARIAVAEDPAER